MSKWNRRLLWLTAFVVACAAYLWFFGVQTFIALETRNIGRKQPIVESVPVELGDTSVSSTKGTRLSFLGVEFEVPLDGLYEAKTRIVGSWALIFFRSGKSIVLCVSPPNGFITSM